jgi:hypothetical protein
MKKKLRQGRKEKAAAERLKTDRAILTRFS